MNLLDIIKQVQKHNELLVKWTKGEIWFADKAVPQYKKDEAEQRFFDLQKELAESFDILESSKVNFTEDEAVECIQLPDELKRKDIEIWLEKWHEFKKRNDNNDAESKAEQIEIR